MATTIELSISPEYPEVMRTCGEAIETFKQNPDHPLAADLVATAWRIEKGWFHKPFVIVGEEAELTRSALKAQLCLLPPEIQATCSAKFALRHLDELRAA